MIVANAPETEREFVSAGVVFQRTGDTIEVLGPKGRADLLEAVRAAVARRVTLLGDEIPQDAGYGVCCGCWDPLPAYRGGMCELCALARRKICDERAARGDPPAWLATVRTVQEAAKISIKKKRNGNQETDEEEAPEDSQLSIL